MGKNIDKRVWGVLGKQQTYYSPQKQVEGKTKTPLNANAFDSWDAKRSRFKRIDGYNVSDAAQQGGTVIGQSTSAPVSSPTPTPTPSFTPTQTNTSTPTNTPTPTSTPEIDCIWSLTDELWENNSNLWNVCQPVITPTPTNTQTNTSTPTNTPTNTPTPSTTPPASGTSEAQTYLRAVVDAGGTGITSTVSAATITLFTSLVSNNLWDKVIAFYPMLGGNSSGCKFNGKNPVDTNGAYRLVFNGGWTFNASGATSNGTNAYANTFLSASTITPLNSQHLSIYMGNTNVSGVVSRFYAGASGGGFFGVGFSSSLYWYYGVSDAGGSVFPFTTAQSQGNILITANATASSLLYRNGTQQQTTVNGNGASIPYSVYIGAYNNGGTAASYYNNQYRFSTIGYGLSAAQQSTLSTIINTFQTSLTRNTY